MANGAFDFAQFFKNIMNFVYKMQKDCFRTLATATARFPGLDYGWHMPLGTVQRLALLRLSPVALHAIPKLFISVTTNGVVRSLREIDVLVQKIDSLALRMCETLSTDWLIKNHVQNILQPSFVAPFDVVGPRHLPAMP